MQTQKITPASPETSQTLPPPPIVDPLFVCVRELLKRSGYEKPLSVLGHALLAPGAKLTHRSAVVLFERHGFVAEWRHSSLNSIIPELFPVILELKGGGACLVLSPPGSGLVKVIDPLVSLLPIERPVDEISESHSGLCLQAKPDHPPSALLESREGEERQGHWLFGTLKMFKGFYKQAALASVLVNLLTIAGSFYAMNIYDRVIPHKGYSTLLALTIGAILALVFEDVLKHLRTKLLEKTARRADYILSNKVFRHLLTSRLENIPSSPGALANVLREYASIREFMTSATLTALADLPFVFMFLALVAWVGGLLVLVPTTLIVVMAIGLYLAQKPLAEHADVQFGASASQHGLLVETIEGLETAKAVQGEGVLLSRWDHYNELIGAHAMKNRTIQSNIGLFISTMQQGGNTILLCFGAYLAGEGMITSGVLIAAAILNGRILAPIAVVGGLASRYQHFRKAFDTLDKFMKSETDCENLGSRVIPDISGSGKISVQSVDFSYPNAETKILNGISLNVASGTHLGLLGEVGCGKSTLLRIMSGLFKPQSGSVLLDDIDIKQLHPAYLRGRIGVLSQEPRLFSGTLRDNLLMGGRVADDWFARVVQATGVHDIAARHPRGYQMVIGDKGSSLSGGQKQLIAWARMLLANPSIIFMDEPTSALDPKTEQRFMLVMRDYLKGKTVVLITHKLNLLELVDRVAVVNGGKIEIEDEKSAVIRLISAQKITESEDGRIQK